MASDPAHCVPSGDSAARLVSWSLTPDGTDEELPGGRFLFDLNTRETFELLKGELAVAREDIDCADFDPNDMGNLHIQAISRATLSVPGQADQKGIGVFEQLILGPYRPLGV